MLKSKVQKVLYTRDGRFCYFIQHEEDAEYETADKESYTELFYVLRYVKYQKSFESIGAYYGTDGVFNYRVSLHVMDIINL